MENLTIVATIITIIGGIYVLIIGQKSLPELWKLLRLRKSGNKIETLNSTKNEAIYLRNNLPPRPLIIGRSTELSRLSEIIKTEENIISVDGLSGMGKSVLVLEFAHQLLNLNLTNRKEYQKINFSAIIWVPALTTDGSLSFILDTISRVMEFTHLLHVPFEEKLQGIYSILRENKILLLIDGLEKYKESTVINFINQVPNPSKCIVTKRVMSLLNSFEIPLKGLTKNETAKLIDREISSLDLNINPEFYSDLISRLYETTNGAPLAIIWAIRQIRYRGETIETVLEQLLAGHADLFETCFEGLWNTLSPSAQESLLQMALLIAPTNRENIKALTGLMSKEFDDIFGSLVDMWFIEASNNVHESEREYSLQPLTRSFTLSKKINDNERLKELKINYISHYMNYLEKYGDKYWEHYNYTNYYLIEREYNNIKGAMNYCIEESKWTWLIFFYKSLMHFMGQRGYWADRLDWGEKTVLAAKTISDTETQSWVLIDGIGWILLEQNNLSSAREKINSGLEIVGNNKICEAIAYWHLARITRISGMNESSREFIQLSMNLDPPKRIVSRLHLELGKIEYSTKNYKGSLSEYKNAEDISENISDTTGIINCNIELGYSYLELSDFRNSEMCFVKAEKLAEISQRKVAKVKAKMGLIALLIRTDKNELAKTVVNEIRIDAQHLGLTNELNQIDLHLLIH